MKSADTRNLPLPPGGADAAQVMMNYVSDRSAALILSPPMAEHPFIGSATAVMIGDHLLLATAGHNLEGITDASQIRIMPRGEFPHPGLPLVARSSPVDKPDVGWIELAPGPALASSLRFLQLIDLKCEVRHDPAVPFQVQGFPAAEVTAVAGRVEPFSLNLITSSVEGHPDRLVLEYPPQSSADRGLALVHPRGMSGGGVWEVPRFDSSPVWTPDHAHMVAIVQSVAAERHSLFTEPIEEWLRLVATDFPSLCESIRAVHGA